MLASSLPQVLVGLWLVVFLTRGAHSQATDRDCFPSEIKCSNGRCIHKSWVCDGNNDCDDNSDEINCGTRTCGSGEFFCASGGCISPGWVCDGEVDCPDGSDELSCVQSYALGLAECNDPGEILFGSKQASNFTVGGEVTYQCCNGFMLVGSRVRVCESSGEWSGEAPKCQGPPCAEPGPIENGLVFAPDGFSVGREIQYRCKFDYVLDGMTSAICLANGQWSNPPPKCKAPCTQIPTALGGWKVGGNKHGDVTMYGCNCGYKFMGSPQSRCVDGQWYPQPEYSCKECSPCTKERVEKSCLNNPLALIVAVVGKKEELWKVRIKDIRRNTKSIPIKEREIYSLQDFKPSACACVNQTLALGKRYILTAVALEKGGQVTLMMDHDSYIEEWGRNMRYLLKMPCFQNDSSNE